MRNNNSNIIRCLFMAATVCVGTAVHAAPKDKSKPLYKDKNAPIEQRVEDLLSRMTLHEKVCQLRNYELGKPEEMESHFNGESYGTTHDMSLPAYDCAVAFTNLQNYMRNNTRLGIPILTSVEGIQGILQNGCTLFPHAIAQGSTFNPALVQRMTEAAGEEAKTLGIHQILSPVFDIARDLRWGRIEETFGECPFLIAEMGIAFVKGYQTHRITCMPKHFIAHGTPSGGLNCASVAGGPRELHSLYLYPFRRVIKEAKPLAVMSCYSAYDGVATAGSRYYMTDLLRGELGFDGHVYSDWGAIGKLHDFHHVVDSHEDAARISLHAGVDIDLYWAYASLENQVNDGRVPMSEIDTAVRRVLTSKFKLGLFDAPYGEPKMVKKLVHNAEKIALAKEVADESAVLVENNGILPLDMSKYKSIAVVGPNSNKAVMGDYAWTSPDDNEGVTLLQGLRNRLGDTVVLNHAEGCDWWSQDDSHIAEAVEAVKKSDLAIVAVGTRSTWLGRGPRYSTAGEAFDLSSLELPGRQLDLLKEIKKTGKPIVLVFISGKPLVLKWAKENTDAILVQWYAGEQQGNAAADILLGNVNPSGRLNLSFPRSTGNTPCFYNHYWTDRENPYDAPGSIDEPRLHYVFEGPDPLWDFGHGLSYTKFDYVSCVLSDSVFTSENDTLTVNVTVRNSGQRDGKEVVQLYVCDKVSSVATPKQQMRAFGKKLIKAGEEQTYSLRLPISELALYNQEMKRVVEPGEFEIQIGSASDRIHFRKTITMK